MTSSKEQGTPEQATYLFIHIYKHFYNIKVALRLLYMLYMQSVAYLIKKRIYNPHDHPSDQNRNLPPPDILLAVILLKPNL